MAKRTTIEIVVSCAECQRGNTVFKGRVRSLSELHIKAEQRHHRNNLCEASFAKGQLTIDQVLGGDVSALDPNQTYYPRLSRADNLLGQILASVNEDHNLEGGQDGNASASKADSRKG